jgi:hypothetical protein
MSHVAPATSAQRTSPQHLQAQISHETLVQLFHQTFSSTHTPRSQDQCRTSLPRRPRNAQASNTFKLRTHTRPSFNRLIKRLPARWRYLRRANVARRSRDVRATHKPATPPSSELTRDARSTLSSKVFQHAHATFEGAKGDNVAPATSASHTSPQYLQAQNSHETLVQLSHRKSSSTHTLPSKERRATMSHVAPATSASRTSPQHLQAQISPKTLFQLSHQTSSSTLAPPSQERRATMLVLTINNFVPGARRERLPNT